MRKVVCLDFDGVIADYCGWRGEDVLGEPLEGAREFVQKLIDSGYEVVIHSARAAVRIEEWLVKHQFPDSVQISIKKPIAIVYIDDRGLRFRGDFDEIFGMLDCEPWWKGNEIG